MEIGKYGVNPDNTEYTGTHDYNKGWNCCFSKTSRCGNRTIHKGRYTVGECHNRQTRDTRLYNCLIACEQIKERIASQIETNAENQTDNKGIKQTYQVGM